MKQFLLILVLLLSPQEASLAQRSRQRVWNSYGWGMDPFGGGVTYEYPPFREQPGIDQEATPAPGVWNRHDGLSWRHRGYQGGESGYHGPFDEPR